MNKITLSADIEDYVQLEDYDLERFKLSYVAEDLDLVLTENERQISIDQYLETVIRKVSVNLPIRGACKTFVGQPIPNGLRFYTTSAGIKYYELSRSLAIPEKREYF